MNLLHEYNMQGRSRLIQLVIVTLNYQDLPSVFKIHRQIQCIVNRENRGVYQSTKLHFEEIGVTDR